MRLKILLSSVVATAVLSTSTITSAGRLEGNFKKLTQQFKYPSGINVLARNESKRFRPRNKMVVTATAYNSLSSQTDSTPNIAAWGDRLRPNMKVIAVSRDLLHKHGMKHGTKVKIKGLAGVYIVLDKMNKRWRKTIDIYMGKSRRKARHWGRRRIEIQW